MAWWPSLIHIANNSVFDVIARLDRAIRQLRMTKRPPSRAMTTEDRATLPPLSKRWSRRLFKRLSTRLSKRLSRDARVPSRGEQRPSGAAACPLSESRGRREGRALAAPVARLQKKMQAAGTTGSAETARPSPRNGFTTYFALSPGTGFVAPVAHDARQKHRELGISSGMPGPHDFVVRAGASRLLSPSRPSQPASTYRDDAYVPLR